MVSPITAQLMVSHPFGDKSHDGLTKKSIQTRQMPIDTYAYQTFADQTFADHDFCLSGLLPIGYQNGFYWSSYFKKGLYW